MLTAPATPTDSGRDGTFAGEMSCDVVLSANAPAADTTRRLPVFRASRIRAVASMSVSSGPAPGGGPPGSAPMRAAVSRVIRLTAALAPAPNVPAICTAPAML